MLAEAGGNRRIALLRAAGVELVDYGIGGSAKNQKTSRNGGGGDGQQHHHPTFWGNVLFLHGFRSSAKAFRKKTGKLRAKLAAVGLHAVYVHAMVVHGWGWVRTCAYAKHTKHTKHE